MLIFLFCSHKIFSRSMLLPNLCRLVAYGLLKVMFLLYYFEKAELPLQRLKISRKRWTLGRARPVLKTSRVECISAYISKKKRRLDGSVIRPPGPRMDTSFVYSMFRFRPWASSSPNNLLLLQVITRVKPLGLGSRRQFS